MQNLGKDSPKASQYPNDLLRSTVEKEGRNWKEALLNSLVSREDTAAGNLIEGFVTCSKIYMKSVCVLDASVDSGGFEICRQRLVINLR